MMIDERMEWLEADGLGGFASGTATGVRTRRYHALLAPATTPPTGRMVMVNGCDVVLVTPTGRWPISTQRYGPDVLAPRGIDHLTRFSGDPWPTWEFATPDGCAVRQELIVEHGTGTALLVWTLIAGPTAASLEVRLLMSGRDYHATHHENDSFAFVPEQTGATWTWRPYAGVPAIDVSATGEYRHAPEWYRNFLYVEERARGLDDREDLASPGWYSLALTRDREAVLLLSAAGERLVSSEDVRSRASTLREAERARRATFPTLLDRAADAYLVRRGQGRTVVAGYPWFTDWGRDTFIAIRGLCLATGRLRDARDILVEWAGAVSEGMLPNRFPDAGEAPEFNSVDASLWFIVAVHELLQLAGDEPAVGMGDTRERLQNAVLRIVEGYAAGTRFGIRADHDGLLAAGEPGLQLTWMDARVDGRVITPRIGKPVEIQALWINALHVAAAVDRRWEAVLTTARQSFADRFWNADRGCLHDVVDVDHQRGTADPTIRPNQILAVGGLPFAAITGARARQVVDVVERDLLTPLGLRSLAPGEPGYAAHYDGGPAQRDAVYHQGTVWPWLLGPFIDAWLAVRHHTDSARRRAARRFLAPVLAQMTTRGLGHLGEIADAVPPFTTRGCPFQAWSVGEILRVSRRLADVSGARSSREPAAASAAP